MLGFSCSTVSSTYWNSCEEVSIRHFVNIYSQRDSQRLLHNGQKFVPVSFSMFKSTHIPFTIIKKKRIRQWYVWVKSEFVICDKFIKINVDHTKRKSVKSICFPMKTHIGRNWCIERQSNESDGRVSDIHINTNNNNNHSIDRKYSVN